MNGGTVVYASKDEKDAKKYIKNTKDTIKNTKDTIKNTLDYHRILLVDFYDKTDEIDLSNGMKLRVEEILKAL